MTTVPLHEQPEVHQRRWFLLGAMCLSLVMVVMSVSSLNLAIPTMQQDLGASASQLQWIVDSYALVFAGLLLTAGALGDRFGRREALLGGLVVFGGGAIVAGVADGASQVIVGRTIQGIGAAFVMPATLSLITVVFPPNERRRAIAIWVGFAGAGGAIGQVVSGALLEAFWWGSAILITVPVVVLVAIAVALFSPESRDESATPLDPVGAVLSIVGLVALIFGIIEGPERGWSDGTVLGAFVIAVVVLVAFLAWERRTEHPMLPLEFFRDRRFSVGSGVITLAFFSMFGFWFMSSQYLQFARGYSPLAAGVAILPMTFVIIAVSPRSASIAERRGSGPTIVAGFLTMAAGFGVLVFMGVSTSYLVFLAALVLLAAGMSITVAPATGNIMSAIPMHKAGVGSAVNDTTREVGGALGIAVLGSILNAVYRSEIDLSGVPLSPEAARSAEESVGAAHTVAAQVGGPAGDEVLSRAAHAFTDAFNAASSLSVATSLAAAAAVAVAFTRRKERAAVAASEAAETTAGEESALRSSLR
jgi:EmrB/QacA subfamily drug resistance transporter